MLRSYLGGRVISSEIFGVRSTGSFVCRWAHNLIDFAKSQRYERGGLARECVFEASVLAGNRVDKTEIDVKWLL